MNAAITLALAALAQLHTPVPVGTAGSGLPPALAAPLQSSVFLLENTAEQSTCTAFAVSPDGTLLTALHCVRECLVSQGLGEQGSLPQLGLSDLFVAKRPDAPDAACKELRIAALGASEVRVVATGAALSSFDATFLSKFSDLHAEIAARGWDRKANDYAVLQVAVKNPLPCLPLESAPVSAGTPLWAVGFPVMGSGDAPLVLSASGGQAYGNAEASRYYQQLSGSAEQAWARSLYDAPFVIYSDAANNPGQSGGPVIDATGVATGIVSGFTNFSDTKSKTDVHELVAVSLAGLPPALAQRLLEQNRACRRP